MRLAARLAFAALAALPASGCGAREPSVELRGERFAVDIADSLEEQVRGLMFVREMPRDRGMLFVYPAPAPQAFWMKNCYIPLDILFFDGEARFINAHYDVPVCRGDPCPSYASTAPARYVLELNAGVGRALGLERGDALTLP